MIINYIKKYLKEIGLVIGLIFMLLYFFDPNIEEVEVPIRVEIPIPVIEMEFDTVYKPKPYPVYLKGKTLTEIDSTYYDKYQALNDSIKKDSIFKKAITINSYKEKVEDDTLTINLNMKVRGELLEYQVGYKTKPRTATVDTILKIKIPTQNKFFGGISVGMPIIENPESVTPTIKTDLYWKTKGDLLINISLDSEKRVWGGIAWKF